MLKIEFEFDTENNIKIEGKKIFLTCGNFPVKIKTTGKDGKEQKRIINLRFKRGVPKIMVS